MGKPIYFRDKDGDPYYDGDEDDLSADELEDQYELDTQRNLYY